MKKNKTEIKGKAGKPKKVSPIAKRKSVKRTVAPKQLNISTDDSKSIISTIKKFVDQLIVKIKSLF